MQWLAEVCIRRPVFAVMLILALVVAGAVSYSKLGIDRFPKIDLPSIYVRTNYPGAASEEVETEVSQLLEDAVATVSGIDELRSISSDGYSMLLLTFRLDRDVDAATQDVRDAINSVLNRLPIGVDPPIVQKKAARRMSRAWRRAKARTGDDRCHAQIGVPITTRSKSAGSSRVAWMRGLRPSTASSAERW